MCMEYTVRPYKKGEEQYVAEAHRRVYREEYNWGPAFYEYAAAIALDFAKKEHGPGVLSVPAPMCQKSSAAP